MRWWGSTIEERMDRRTLFDDLSAGRVIYLTSGEGLDLWIKPNPVTDDRFFRAVTRDRKGKEGWSDELLRMFDQATDEALVRPNSDAAPK